MLDIFARGGDGAVWHCAYDNGWSGWDTIGGVIASAPAAVSWGVGRIDVVARGQDHALWHIPFDNHWGMWSSLGGALT